MQLHGSNDSASVLMHIPMSNIRKPVDVVKVINHTSAGWLGRVPCIPRYLATLALHAQTRDLLSARPITFQGRAQSLIQISYSAWALRSNIPSHPMQHSREESSTGAQAATKEKAVSRMKREMGKYKHLVVSCGSPTLASFNVFFSTILVFCPWNLRF